VAAGLGLVVAALATSAPAVEDVDAGEPLLVAPSAGGAEAAHSREVAPGDTLWSIAAAAMGDGTLWPALYRANRDRIKDPARIYPGQRLVVPEVDPDSVASVRREGASLATD
jgi:nucleoid-associated protein YgaU